MNSIFENLSEEKMKELMQKAESEHKKEMMIRTIVKSVMVVSAVVLTAIFINKVTPEQ
jgi:frataxin-like iron-binding protein CyaY